MSMMYDVSSLFRRYLTKLVRNPTLLATNLITPVLFLILFSQLLGKLGEFPGVGQSFLSYLTPAVIMMCSIMFGAQAGISIINDLNSGFLQKLLVTPVRRSAILLGRLLTDSLMVVLSSIVVVLIAWGMGVSFATGFPGLLLLLGLAAFFGLAWAGIFLALGMATRSAEALNSIASGLVFILLFISSAMFPSSILPGWAQVFSDWNPVSYVATAMRELVQSGYDWGAFDMALGLTAAIALVSFAATLYQFRRVVS
jgi:ABC-2 type transport system permease protein